MHTKTLQELWDEAGNQPFIAEDRYGLITFKVILVIKDAALGYHLDTEQAEIRSSELREWKLYKPAPKLVKWYYPKIIWWEGDVHPARTDVFSLSKKKDLSHWFKDTGKVSVLVWGEYEFPETCEDLVNFMKD